MPNKTIYVREQDMELWQKAEELAGEESLSAFVAEALKRLVTAKEQVQGGFERIELDVAIVDSNRIYRGRRTVAFQGKLIAEDEGTEVYLTPKGNLLFYETNYEYGGSYKVYGSFREASSAVNDNEEPLYSGDLLDSVADALNEEYVEELPI